MTELADPTMIRLVAELQPDNLREPMQGGIKNLISARQPYDETTGTVETSEDFQRRLYGESYEYQRVIESIYFFMKGLRKDRGERSIDGITHITPVCRIDLNGNILPSVGHCRQTFSTPCGGMTSTVLFYKDWLCLNMPFEVNPVPHGSLDDVGTKALSLTIIPDIYHPDVESAVVLPNPLLYILKPKQIERLMLHLPEQIGIEH